MRLEEKRRRGQGGGRLARRVRAGVGGGDGVRRAAHRHGLGGAPVVVVAVPVAHLVVMLVSVCVWDGWDG